MILLASPALTGRILFAPLSLPAQTGRISFLHLSIVSALETHFALYCNKQSIARSDGPHIYYFTFRIVSALETHLLFTATSRLTKFFLPNELQPQPTNCGTRGGKGCTLVTDNNLTDRLQRNHRNLISEIGRVNSSNPGLRLPFLCLGISVRSGSECWKRMPSFTLRIRICEAFPSELPCHSTELFLCRLLVMCQIPLFSGVGFTDSSPFADPDPRIRSDSGT
ncbi:hypothetical protein AVEN_61299-1 [Araneus ventricosus]|uniref:Uncharacterized protein n=1 Tax=Araneus ventricosus TaxID=182803 RepID=A0A4Y2N9U4_ARAVE|nr:hypothetical protein AVEN_61299-1 [Araneus ventricosus]